MTTRDRVQTNAEFWQFVEMPENADKFFELIEGIPVEMPSPSPLHGVIAAKILYFIMAYLAQHDIGYAVGDANGLALAEGIVFKPDAAFISTARLPELPLHFELAPDIAVEVVSPRNSSGELLYKVEQYIRYGTKYVWVVYPEDRLIYVYRPVDDGSLNLHRLTAADTLDGGEVLPGFGVRVGELFPGIPSDQR